ncbi:MAG: nucleotide sugar dehydrogenase [Aliishimia sp.]
MSDRLLEMIRDRRAKTAVMGLGYVGLPLAMAAQAKGLPVLGVDLDTAKLGAIRAGQSYIEAISDADLAAAAMDVTDEMTRLAEADVIVICVPTPLTAHRTPDLGAVKGSLDAIARHASPETLVVLESTTWPGTTAEVMAPALADLKQAYVAFSPEREDPGNQQFNTRSIPKLVAGLGDTAGDLAEAFYESFLDQVVRVKTPAIAEAAKITENVFRSVNIALVNELKMIFDRMDIDVWDVIDAAATKPFGYMPFYPGPGLGGHCIPVDPFYLSWKAREFGLNAQFIELAGEINIQMPDYAIAKLREVLDIEVGLPLSKSRILVIGAAYKKNVSDLRESPAMEIMARLHDLRAQVSCLDPHVPVLTHFHRETELDGRATIVQSDIKAAEHDAVMILTDHDGVDYEALAALKLPIVDTRNVMARKGVSAERLFKA